GVGENTRRTARQRHPEVAAGAAAHHRDVAAVRLGELARDGEPEPAALHPARHAALAARAAAEKEIEDGLALLGRHAGPGVHHLDHRLAADHARFYRDRAARRRELHRIADQVVEDGAQLL